MIYTKEEVRAKTLTYFNGDELATNVWMDKYCLKNLKGEFVENSPLMMHERLAGEFHRIELKYKNAVVYDEIYNLLKEQTILPGGSLLYGIGNSYSISSLGNCFVIGNDADSYGGICTIDQEQVQLMKRRAGVGHDLSHLRQKGTPTTNAARTSSGIVPFMERYSNSTREVAQDGRRGALMLSCSINHPQAEDFITAKDDTTKVTGANISVKVDDKFMKEVTNKVSSFRGDNYFLWNKLVHQAWKSAEPGVLFWDTIIRESPADCYEGFKSTSTNPCGEIPLCPYDSCRLLSINLYSFVDNPFTPEASFNWERFKHVVYIAQKLMDDVVDLEEEKINKILEKIDNDPESEEIKAIEKNLWLKIKKKLLDGRRTGLSGIGLADTLAAINIRYTDGISVAEEIYKQLAITAYKSSIDMAKDRGTFPIWDFNKETNNPFLDRIFNSKELMDGYNPDVEEGYIWDAAIYGRRNIALLTIPPSGTIALEAGISSGIEPVYMLSHKRRRKVNPDHPNITFKDKNGDCWEEYVVLHPKFEEWFKIINNKSFKEMLVFGKTAVPTTSPYHGSTAYELNPLDRVKMQGAIQKWVDHSISSTINLPKEATEEDVSNIYMEAWKLGCKGITIYRDGCRDGVLISSDQESHAVFDDLDAIKRPKSLKCDIIYTTSKGVEYNILVGLLNDKPYEVFGTTDLMTKKNIKGNIIKVARSHYKVNGDINRDHLMENMSQAEKMATRGCSVMLRHRVAVKYVIDYLQKTAEADMQNFNKVLARALKRYIKDNEKVTGATCENCGSTNLIYVGGCLECKDCGSSKCG